MTTAPPTGEREGSRVHDLKIWPEFFEELLSGRKTFEARWNDRDYRVGDVLWLREWKPPGIGYTGRELRRTVTYALFGSAFGVAPGFVILALAAAPAQPGEGEPLDVIAGLLAIIDEWRDETEGKRPSPSASCFECTSGTVPDRLNKGPCAEHRARALLERRGGKGLDGKGGG